jgi:site-specific recombinase XerD
MALGRTVERWLDDGKAQGWSARTLGNRRRMMEKLAWWLQNEVGVRALLSELSPATIRAFLSYTREERPEGRFGSAQPNARHAARPSTVQTYFGCIRAFVNFCLAEGLLTESPLANVKSPRVPKDQIQPLDPSQVQALVDAARRSRAPERDVALILLLVDTGMRVGELCRLIVTDVDRGAGSLTVVGKGNKRRTVYMGAAARRALWRYLETDRRDAAGDEPLFIAVGSCQTPDGRLTPNGIGQLMQRLAGAAGLRGIRCSPHTLRHTFAVSFLRGGGSVLELQRLLGHESLEMTRRYVALAEADLAQAHRSASPADRMKLR